jgi:dienelactone hydrolase
MRFGRYAELADGDVWPEEIAGDLRQRLQFANGPLARSLSEPSYAALLARPMRAVENAAPLAGPFPLIVIGLGLYYESPVTFATTAEYLAGRGFVVATAPLVGTHTALVRLNVPDLETQIRDLELVIARARQFSFVDPERLGVMGFDQGGMAGLVLAMRNRDVDVFVSMDSGIQYPHASGLPRSSQHYDPLALRVPWLHAARAADQPRADGAQSLFDEAVHSERYWLRVQDLGHADYTSYGLVEGRGEVPGYWSAVTPARTATHRVVAEYVLHFSGVSGRERRQHGASTKPAGDAAERRYDARAAPAPPALIDYDEVV